MAGAACAGALGLVVVLLLVLSFLLWRRGPGGEGFQGGASGPLPSYLHYYQQLVDDTKNGWEAQGYGGEEAQEARFRVLADEFALDGRTILDVGCGQGDFARYLARRDIHPARLYGIDGIKEFVEKARGSAPLWASYAVGDPIADPAVLGPSLWDWVILCGVVTSHGFSAAKPLLEACWRRARHGMAFNFLSQRRKNKSSFIHHDPDVWVAWAQMVGASSVRLRHDYLGDLDATVVMRR